MMRVNKCRNLFYLVSSWKEEQVDPERLTDRSTEDEEADAREEFSKSRADSPEGQFFNILILI